MSKLNSKFYQKIGAKGLINRWFGTQETNFTCKVCGKEDHVKPRLLRLGKKYCSLKCKFLNQPQGENAYNWKGGVTKDMNAYKREWRQNHKDYVNYACKVRRLRLLGVEGNHTLGEWETLKAQYNWRCPSCLESEPEIILTEDHIIPITKGGSDNIENIQPLCKSCNSSKYTKIIRF